jgi:hypothetical protein
MQDKGGPKMQKWEYCKLVLTSGSRIQIVSKDGTTKEYPINATNEWQVYISLLNQLGNQGWEVVTAEGLSTLLKRLKPESQP